VSSTQARSKKLVVGHVLAGVSIASILSAIFALLLRPFYHGYFDAGGADHPSGWVKYFDFEILRVDYRIMLLVFGLLFLLLPVFIGVRLSRRNPEPQFGRWYGIAIFLVTLVAGVCFNLWVGLIYALAGFNSSDPF
jgi:hypothetical protein